MALLPSLICLGRGIGDLSDLLDYPYDYSFVTGRPTRGSYILQPKAPKEWTHRLDCRGFCPHDIEVKPENGKVKIHALHRSGNDDNGNSYEMKRLIAIPEDVDSEKVTSNLLSNGILLLKAPHRHRKENDRTVAIQGLADSGLKVVEKDGKKYVQAQVNAGGFDPSEISIKCRGNVVTVDAKHEEKKDGHVIYKELRKTYSLPEGVNPEALSAGFDDDKNCLMLTAPYEPRDAPEERSVPLNIETFTSSGSPRRISLRNNISETSGRTALFHRHVGRSHVGSHDLQMVLGYDVIRTIFLRLQVYAVL